jgi:tetratricopeptide (TPR) repeat protein
MVKDGTTPMEKVSLYQQATTLVEQCKPEVAIPLLQQALTQQPNNTLVMDLAAEALLQTGASEQAFILLQQSCQLAPAVGPNKWLQLAQLQEGAKAVQCVQQGIRLLQAEVARGDAELAALDTAAAAAAAAAAGGTVSAMEAVAAAATAATRRKLAAQVAGKRRGISNAFCACIELYMTPPCCDDGDAEAQCETLVAAAVAASPENAEAHAALCNLRLVQGRCDEAKAALHTALTHLTNLYDRMYAHDDDDVGDGGGGGVADSMMSGGDGAGNGGGEHVAFAGLNRSIELELPSYAARFEIVKMCVELDAADYGVDLVEKLLAEDDSAADVWYFGTLCALHCAYCRQTQCLV